MKYTQAYGGFAVKDTETAQKFYAGTLGLQVKANTEMGALMLELILSNGTHILVYPKPDHTPATYTILNFNVENIDAVVDELTSAGVTFEHYDEEYIKTDAKGISRSEKMDIAWFTDPSGNILSLIQEKS